MGKNSDTQDFIRLYEELKGKAWSTNKELAKILGYKTGNSITEIIKGRQQIDTEKYKIFTETFQLYIDQLKLRNVEFSLYEKTFNYKKTIEDLYNTIKEKEAIIKDKEEIINLQKMLLDKSLSPDKDIVNDQ